MYGNKFAFESNSDLDGTQLYGLAKAASIELFDQKGTSLDPL